MPPVADDQRTKLSSGGPLTSSAAAALGGLSIGGGRGRGGGGGGGGGATSSNADSSEGGSRGGPNRSDGSSPERQKKPRADGKTVVSVAPSALGGSAAGRLLGGMLTQQGPRQRPTASASHVASTDGQSSGSKGGVRIDGGRGEVELGRTHGTRISQKDGIGGRGEEEQESPGVLAPLLSHEQRQHGIGTAAASAPQTTSWTAGTGFPSDGGRGGTHVYSPLPTSAPEETPHVGSSGSKHATGLVDADKGSHMKNAPIIGLVVMILSVLVAAFVAKFLGAKRVARREGAACRTAALQNWSSWSVCDVCGGGDQERNRVPSNSTLRAAAEAAGCRLQERRPCPRFASVTDWSTWGSCSLSCGDGALQQRARRANHEARTCGADRLPSLHDSRRCSWLKPCPGDSAVTSTVNAHGIDAVSGFDNTATSTSKPLMDDVGHGSNGTKRTPVGDGDGCAVHDWSSWEACSRSCGDGHRKRVRRRNNLGVVCGADSAKLVLSETSRCFEQPCWCGFGEWSAWTDCSATCGFGRRERRRLALASVNAGCQPLADVAPCEASNICDVPCSWGASSVTALPGAEYVDRDSLFRCEALASGRSCDFTCVEGFVPATQLVCLSGAFMRTSGGSTGPLCEEASCEDPPEVAHAGDLTYCVGASAGTTCAVACLDGFVKSGGNAVCRRGVWSKVACQPAACIGDLPSVPHAASSVYAGCGGQRERPSAMAIADCPPLECDDGYEARGSQATCVRGTWVMPICVERGCALPPEVPQGDTQAVLSCAPAMAGNSCSLRCLPGFVKTADPICAGGRWSPAHCLPAGSPCLRAYSSGGNSFSPDDGCSAHRCGPAPSKLLRHGELNKIPQQCFGADTGSVCGPAEASTCNPPAASSGRGGNESGIAKGSGDFFRVQPAGRLICEDGQWTGEGLHCEEPRCEKIPAVPFSGDLGACAGAVPGVVCKVVCSEGHVSTEDAVCRGGRWIGGRCDPARCVDLVPTLAHGTVDAKSCTNLAPSQTCQLSCATGFELQGNLSCLGATTLAGAQCVRARCKAPPRIDDSADLSMCAGAPNGAVCRVMCSAGFERKMDSVCVDGNWTEARCLPRACGELPRIVGANTSSLRSCVGLSSGVSCSGAICQPGFTLMSDTSQGSESTLVTPTLECVRGIWGSVSRCVPSARCGTSFVDLPLARWPLHSMNVPQTSCNRRGAFVICGLVCDPNHVKTADVICTGGEWLMPLCVPRPGRSTEGSIHLQGARVEISMRIKRFDVTGSVVGDYIDFEARLLAAVANTTRIDLQRLRLEKLNVSDNIAEALETTITSVVEIWPVATNGSNAWFGGISGPISVSDAVLRLVSARDDNGGKLSMLSGYKLEPGSPRLIQMVLGAPCLLAPYVRNALRLETCAPALDGRFCPLLCAIGYVPTADLMCINGSWSPPSIARCEEAACFEMPSLVEGGEDLSPCRGYPSGSNCPLRCRPGWRPDFTGVGVAFCYQGKWDLGNFACVPESCDLPLLLRNSAPLDACTGMAHGRRCQPLCLPGFALTTTDGVECFFGNWRYDLAARCERTGCLTVPVVPGSTSALDGCAGMAPYGRCSFSCAPGLEQVGDLICVAGQWTRPRCQARKCDDTPIVDGVPLERCTGMASGRACRLDCSAGQIATGPLLCYRGIWQNIRAVRCVGSKVSTQQPHRQRWRLRRGGIPGTGGTTPVAHACKRRPDMQHADGPDCDGTPSGATCPATPCNPGYRLDALLMCVDGQWTSARCVAMPCVEAPKVSHAISLQRCHQLPKGGSCPLQCSAGFTPGGTLPASLIELQQAASVRRFPGGSRVAALVCGEGATFVPEGSAQLCRPAPCGSYPAMAFAGDLSACVGAAAETTCDVMCAKGFVRAGDGGALWCSNGMWLPDQEASDLPPSVLPAKAAAPVSLCQPAPCGSPPFPVNARDVDTQRCAGTLSGRFCSKRCLPGTVQVSPLLCQRGQWVRAKEDDCQRVCVNEPPSIPHSLPSSILACAPVAGNDACPVECKVGYWPTGDLLCDPEDLSWNVLPCEPFGGTDVGRAANFFFGGERQVEQSMELHGLQAKTAAEVQGVARVLQLAMARRLHMNAYTIEVLLREGTPVLPPILLGHGSAASSVGTLETFPVNHVVVVRVRCGAACGFVKRRLILATRRTDSSKTSLPEELSSAVCASRCSSSLGGTTKVGSGGLEGCFARCPEGGGRLKVVSYSEARLVV
eukprot:TRINITY_DN38197_c0_g1_i1.p1 TRINITY_DN38197_c0_g1~~TRINITY_DN38197_c0_g1_i1.p1  ORF type:complete len:2209 (+),score=307.63 TRINITY_DN38197_c0_g1_i1:90-6716(+)